MRTARALTVSRGGGYQPGPGGCNCLSRGGVPAWSRGDTCLVCGGMCTCLAQGGTCLARGGTCLAPGGYLPGPGGVPAWSWGGTCLVPGGCTCLVGGVPAWPRGGTCLAPGGVPAWSGRRVTCLVPGGVPGQALPPLWTEFLTHASENITLPQTSFAGGNNFRNLTILPRKCINHWQIQVARGRII